MTATAGDTGWNTLWSSRLFGRFVLLSLGVWLHAADSLVTATVMPAVVDDIGGIAYVGWTISLYQIGAIVAGAATAMLCRRAGVKRVLVTASAVYACGCAAAALAPAMPVLLGARLAQGIGGGMLVSLSYVAIQQSFPEHLWSRLFAIEAALWAGGSLLGPLIGGIFVHLHVWRWAFWFFAVQAAGLAGAAGIRFSPQPSRAGAVGGWPKAPLLMLATGTLLIAEAGTSQPVALSIGEGLGGAMLLWAAVRLDRRGGDRLFPRQTLRLRHPVGSGLLMIFSLSMATTGFWAYGPLLLKIMFGTDPLVSGFILAGEALAWSAATVAISGLPAAAARSLIVAGASLVALGVAGFAIAVPTGTFAGMVVCGLMQGLGFGLFWPSCVHRIVRLADDDERELAAAGPGTVQRIGYAVGAAAAGIVANLSGLADGMSVDAARVAGVSVFASFAPLLVLAMVAAWQFVRTEH